ncbi:MAG TPA: tetratricopeptide repeat protein [Vicinamibacteria bacterium]|nr:tetratricopeptide repeat protein [Vicinamibacteria bacterium]
MRTSGGSGALARLAGGAVLALLVPAGTQAARPLPQDPGQPAKEVPLPQDHQQLETIDGELPMPAMVDPRSVQIGEALRGRDYERAEALLLEVAAAQPQSAEALRLLGGVFFLRGRPLNAAVALKKAEAIAPLDDRSRFTLVMAYVALGHRDWARPELAKLAQAAPANALYAYWTGRLDYDEGQFASAVKGFARAIELDPRQMKAHDNLGLCYEALGRFDEAQRSWEEAIRLNAEQQGKSPWPSHNLGLLLTRLDRMDAAEARFREALASDPRFAPAHYQLGLVLEKRGRPTEAIPEVEEAARLDPAYADAQYALARLYRRTGDQSKADRALLRFEEIKKQKDVETGRAPR